MTERSHKRYTREFKREAVRLADSSELPGTQVARQLGVHRNMLAQWRKELAELGEGAFVHDVVDVDQMSELDRVRQELALVRRENDILKKALAIISREQGSALP